MMDDSSKIRVRDRLAHAVSAFARPERELERYAPPQDYGASYSHRPNTLHYSIGGERSITSSVYTRLAMDVAALDYRHVRLDENDRYYEDINSYLNQCLSIEANIDQASRAFFQDIATTLFDRGVAAIVPIETTRDPFTTDGYDILSMRVGEIITWYPRHVVVSVYNDLTGKKEELTLEKRFVAIVENPLFSVMNEPNSTLQRLKRKLAMLDAVDEQTSSGKLDLIIQLPYVVRNKARRDEANTRRKDIEEQLRGGKYGIAYTDGTERIHQLNRPAENNLLKQIEYLTNMLYSELGITTAVFDGTAEEAVMLNYHTRTIEPIVSAIVQAMHRRFLSKTARSQRQAIMFYRDPFKLVPVEKFAEIADKFTRNEIATGNEIRTSIGWKPSKDPRADELRNKNLSAPKEENNAEVIEVEAEPVTKGELQNGTR